MNPTAHTNEHLLRRLASGDQEAFSVIYKRFYERVLCFARRFVDDVEAIDITADAFFEVWQNRGRFPHINALSSFLFVTTRNRCYDIIRHKKVKSRHEKDLIALMEAEGRKDFFFEQVTVELKKILAAEISRLPEKMRQVFQLSFDSGMKPSEIAAVMKTSVKTVSNQKLAAIKTLRSALRRYSSELTCFVLLHMAPLLL